MKIEQMGSKEHLELRHQGIQTLKDKLVVDLPNQNIQLAFTDELFVIKTRWPKWLSVRNLPVKVGIRLSNHTVDLIMDIHEKGITYTYDSTDFYTFVKLGLTEPTESEVYQDWHLIPEVESFLNIKGVYQIDRFINNGCVALHLDTWYISPYNFLPIGLIDIDTIFGSSIGEKRTKLAYEK